MSADLPRSPSGGYAMWIFRYRRGDEFEEIHVPRYDGPGELREMRARARALADETGSVVAWVDGVTSAMVNSNYQTVRGRPLWMVTWPRVARAGATAFKVVECPNIDDHRRDRPELGICDRCKEPTPATEMVACYLGCEHPQCTACAEQTRREAADEDRYDRRRAGDEPV